MTCTHSREVIAIDSAGRKIMSPCLICHQNWLAHHCSGADEQNDICDECGGDLAMKDGQRFCTQCKEVYM